MSVYYVIDLKYHYGFISANIMSNMMIYVTQGCGSYFLGAAVATALWLRRVASQFPST